MFKNIPNRIKENLVSLIFVALTVVLALLGGILYLETGVTPFAPKLDTTVLVLAFVGAGVSALSVVFSWKTLKYIAFVIMLAAFLEFVRVELDFIANVFVGIDRTSFTPEFMVTIGALLLSAITAFVSGITGKEFEIGA